MTARILLSPPHLTGEESARIAEVLATNWLAPAGPHLEEFERRFAAAVGQPYAAAVASGTAALHLALRHLSLAPGDEVYCSTLTFCASANPIVYERAAPVFIDSDRTSWNMDPALLEEALEHDARRGQLPKAVIVVDVFGQSADLRPIRAACDRHGVPLIADAAESLGATYRDQPVGAEAWAAVFSFNGNKIITTSGGGMLCSGDRALIDHARKLATQAREPAAHYQHEEIGHNYRMSNLLAAVGLAQLQALPQRVAARRRICQWYQERLSNVPGITIMPEASYGVSNRWLTVITIDPHRFGVDRETVRLHLEGAGIESRPAWKPLHLQPVFRHCRRIGGAVSEEIFAHGLCLPSGSALTESEVERVSTLIIESATLLQDRAAAA